MTAQQWRTLWREFDSTAHCPYCGHGVSDDENQWRAIKQLVKRLVEKQLKREKKP